MAATKPLNVYNAKVDGTAIGNGTVDDTNALQTLIDNAEHGASIYLPAGVYKLTATLLVKDKKVNIYGDGIDLGAGGTWLKRTADAAAITYSITPQGGGAAPAPVYGNTLCNLAIDGMTSFNSDAVSVSYQSCMRLDNLLISKSGGNGLYLKSVWDSVFQQVFIWHCGKSSAGKAALFIEGVDGVSANNDHRYQGCHFEHCQDGPLLIAAGPTVVGPLSMYTNSVVFENCKFEASGRVVGDGSPIQLTSLTNSAFVGCRFSMYGRALDGANPADRAYAMTVTQCAGLEVVAALCVNNLAPPSAFAGVIASSLCRFSLRGYVCGDIELSGVTRGITSEVSDYGTPLRSAGRYLLDFPPLKAIDVQTIAGAKHDTVADATALRGRALLLQTSGVSTDGLSLQIGGGGALGITVSMLVRVDSGGNAYRFEVMKNGATLVLSQFTAAASYRREYCVLPRDFVMADAILVLRGVNAGSALRVADVLWEQGMFSDVSPENDPSLQTSITFEKGETLLKRSFFVVNSIEGWGVYTEGTTANPASAGLNGSMVAMSNQLTLTSGTTGKVMVGTYLNVPGASFNAPGVNSRAQVQAIAGTSITFNATTTAAVTNVAVTFAPPTFKTLGSVQIVQIFSRLHLATFVIALGLLFERLWRAFSH